jgi:hypothetical protein
MAHLTCTIADGLATIVLDNPPQNRLTVQLCDELDRAVQEISASEAPRSFFEPRPESPEFQELAAQFILQPIDIPIRESFHP